MANTAASSGELNQTWLPDPYNDLLGQVRLRAYEIYELRGREHGHALEDWLQAESELVPSGLKVQFVEHSFRLVAA